MNEEQHEVYLTLPLSDIKEKIEYRSLLPSMIEGEYVRLREDIKQRGIQIPLIINEKKELIDGYTRLRIARELGIQHIPCIIRSFANELEEKEFVLTINAYRRHMNTAQKVEVAVKLLEIEREKAKLRQKFKNREQARRLLTSDINISVLPSPGDGSDRMFINESKLGGKEEVEEREEEEDKEEGEEKKGEALKIVAKRMKISYKTLWKGLEIKEKAKQDQEIAELWNKALRGEVSLEHAYSELKRREQHERLQLLQQLQQKQQQNPNNNANNSNNSSSNNSDTNYYCCSTNNSSSNSSSKKERKFNVILADPPWQYEFGLRGNAEQHYPCLSLEEIAKVFEEHKDKGEIAYPCILFLWATAPKLREALQLLDMLGFEYKTNMVWVKDKIGTGYYVRNKHELLLIAVKGDMPLPLEHNRPDSVMIAERKGEHSRKPDIVYDIIERMYPNCSYLELFAREKRREGWEAYGLDLND